MRDVTLHLTVNAIFRFELSVQVGGASKIPTKTQRNDKTIGLTKPYKSKAEAQHKQISSIESPATGQMIYSRYFII